MAVCLETIPRFKGFWIECLGILSRYLKLMNPNSKGLQIWNDVEGLQIGNDVEGLQIGNDVEGLQIGNDVERLQIWNDVATYWYNKAVDEYPEAGRLYHCLALLAQSKSLQQLSLYARSSTCVEPYERARDCLIEIIKQPAHQPPSFETAFIEIHGVLLSGDEVDKFNVLLDRIGMGLFDNYIGSVTARFKTQGVFVANLNIAALFEYGSTGSSNSSFRLAFQEIGRLKGRKTMSESPQLIDGSLNIDGSVAGAAPGVASCLSLESLRFSESRSSPDIVFLASRLTFSMLSIGLQRINDKNVLPFLHVSLVFVWSLASVEKAMAIVEQQIPWGELCAFLNALIKHSEMSSNIFADGFPESNHTHLPEDFIIRGQMYSLWYFPDTWFKDTIDEDERLLELPSMDLLRMERILWLGTRIASVCLTGLMRKIELMCFS